MVLSQPSFSGTGGDNLERKTVLIGLGTTSI
jgi:hypothetical protein